MSQMLTYLQQTRLHLLISTSGLMTSLSCSSTPLS